MNSPLRGRLGCTLLIKIFQPLLGGHISEIAGATIPGCGLSRISGDAANTDAIEKTRIESRPEPQRRGWATRIGGAFVKQPSRNNVTGAEETIAASYESSDLCQG